MASPSVKAASWIDETAEEGELTVDVYQNSDTIFVKAMIAGVRPEDLDINISRDMVTIRGKREEERVSSSDDYFIRELYWDLSPAVSPCQKRSMSTNQKP